MLKNGGNIRKEIILRAKTGICIGVFTCLLIQPCFSEVIQVALEPFPPLITKEGKGFTVEMLRAIEEMSDYQFEIRQMPYNRAKIELKTGNVDLIGHTPKGMETKDFYEYAMDLNWSVESKTDVYVVNKSYLQGSGYKKMRIGAPRGNKEFYSELFAIPVERFYDGDLANLLKMLAKGRIDAFIFERASTMTTIRKYKIKNVYYKNINATLRPGFAVRKNKRGSELKKKMDQLIETLDHIRIYHSYLEYMQLPDDDVVTMPEE